MQPRILVVASVATLTAALLVWVSAPETSVPEAEIPAAAPRSTEAPAPPSSRERPASVRPASPAPAEAPVEPEVAPPAPREAEPYAPDRATVQPASPTGLIMAATARRPELLDCWDDYAERADSLPSGFSIDLTVREEDDGEQQIQARVPDLHDDDLEACLTESFADAQFEPLDQPALRLIWRVPEP